MNKLELKHLAPYLPYGLNVTFEGEEDLYHELVGLDITNDGAKLISPYNDYGSCEIDKCKPILRHLSDYQDINGNAMRELNCDLMTQIEIQDFASKYRSIHNISYDAYYRLIEAKADIFGLIDKNLAIDINTLK